jgi:hypothetical protein
MRLIHTSNFALDYPDERFVEGLPDLGPLQLQQIADLINATLPEDASRYWKVVPDNYVLEPGFEL